MRVWSVLRWRLSDLWARLGGRRTKPCRPIECPPVVDIDVSGWTHYHVIPDQPTGDQRGADMLMGPPTEAISDPIEMPTNIAPPFTGVHVITGQPTGDSRIPRKAWFDRWGLTVDETDEPTYPGEVARQAYMRAVTLDGQTFPHCDSRILHARGKCDYCDQRPEWHEIRNALGLAFTESATDRDHPYMCPAEAAVLAGERGELNAWPGNRPEVHPRG